jgi:multidrug resistance efflux pump
MAIDICATRLDVAANRPVDGVRPEFSERALAAFSAGKLPSEVLQLSGPRVWSVFLLLASLVASGVAVSVLGTVEVTARGRGMVRGAERPVALQAATTGRLDAWRVAAGDKVTAGQIIATLDAADLRAAAAEAQRQAAAIEARAAATAKTIAGKYDEQRKAFADEAKKLEAQLATMHDTESMYQRHVAVMKDLARRQVASRREVDDTAEKLNQIHGDILAAEGQLAEVRQRVSGLEADEQRERLSLTQEVSEAQARRDRTSAMMQEAVLRAPTAGVVDALLVQPGEVAQAGATLGRLVPEATAATVTAVIEERNRAFLQVGSPVRLELDQLPPGEFGALHGTVQRVGADLIPAAELRDMVGVNGTGAWYKVEIALTDDARAQSLGQYLRPGMLVTARYHLRQRRIITLALEPLRYWLKD